MTVLTIRSSRRYAMRLPVWLRTGKARSVAALLIEISQDGARISNLGRKCYEPGEPVTLLVAKGHELEGVIRWAHDGLAGMRFDTALNLAGLSGILDLRHAPSETLRQRYGT